ncbi:MAG: hypothetical protein IT269_06340 [Saprospiraceae bacterium]|nr:hypothetical protein [Saprospiraceae bacterium]
MTKVMKFWLLPLFAFMAFLIACNKDNATSDQIDDAVDQALYSVQERGGIGRFGCYELVFPVTIQLPDSTTAAVNSYDEMKQALRDWFQANGVPQGGGHGQGQGPRPRPQFVFPISVVNESGEIITVANEDELRQLRADCPGATFGNHGPNGHGQHGLSCFTLVFPITLSFPDSTTQTVNSRQEMRDAIHTWRQNNPGVQGRPEIVFPITVQMTDDSSQVVVNSKDDLRDLKESCE